MTVLACHLAPCSVMGPRKDENARGPLVRRRPGALDGVRVCVCRGKETRAWEPEGGETFARKVQAVLLAGAVSLASASGAQAGAIGASHIWGSERDRPILDARNVIPATEARLAEGANIPTEFPPLPELKPAPYQKFKLKNGLTVYLFEDHEVPLLRGTVVFKGGSRVEPEEKAGLTQIMAAVQRTGGSVQHPGKALEDELEELAAQIETGTSENATSVGFECLPEDAAKVMSLFLEVVTSPAFGEEKVALAKTQALDYIAHRNDAPAAIPAREVRRLLYGPQSPYARLPTRANVEGLTRDDLLQFAAKWQRPDLGYLGIVGDFSTPEMRALVTDLFGAWKLPKDQPSKPPAVPTIPIPYPSAAPFPNIIVPPVTPMTPAPTVPPVDAAEGASKAGASGAAVPAPPAPSAMPLYLVPRPGLSSTTLAFGELGVTVRDPEAPALDVANIMLNSFGGRLFTEVRSKMGLSYSVSGRWDMEANYNGTFMVVADTDQPAETIAKIQAVLVDLAEREPPAEEVQAAKSRALNSFAFNFSSKAAQMARVISYDIYGLPRDFLYRTQRDIQAVTPKAVQRAVQSHLHLDKQQIVVVGDPKKVQDNLSKLGRPVVLVRLD